MVFVWHFLTPQTDKSFVCLTLLCLHHWHHSLCLASQNRSFCDAKQSEWCQSNKNYNKSVTNLRFDACFATQKDLSGFCLVSNATDLSVQQECTIYLVSDLFRWSYLIILCKKYIYFICPFFVILSIKSTKNISIYFVDKKLSCWHFMLIFHANISC